MAITDVGKISYNLEYLSKNDDAWYTAGVILENGKRLRVKLEGFASSFDEVFTIDDFSNNLETEEFIRRFRPVSVPFEPTECSRVIEGTTVCATYRGDGSVLFFDAIVDAVYYKDHPKKCLCTFLLHWQHGPEKGNITAGTIDDICQIMSGPHDPRVIDFVKLVREKLQDLNGDEDSSSSLGFSKGRKRLKPEVDDEDKDIGGIKETGSQYYIVLENLEINQSPVMMEELIHEQTSVTTHAYVFSSLSTETYTRGAIIVDTKQKLKRVYEFITNPNHFIVSKSTGRPWVIAEDMLRDGDFNIKLLQPKSEKENTGGKLKVVRLGTEEYERAKISKDIYMEYRNHINGLNKRLGMEELKKWRYPSGTS